MLSGAEIRRRAERDNMDSRFANLEYLLYSLNVDKKHRKLKPKDFMPKYKDTSKRISERKPKRMDDEQMMNVARALNQAWGGDER